MPTLWTQEELEASVIAYLDMQQKELNREDYTKSKVYKKLSNQYKRTEKAFEYRMQNISYVMHLMGRQWISGLKPASHVGTQHIELIERLISKVEGKNYIGMATFEAQVQKHKKKNVQSQPQGEQKPQITQSHVTKYQRDPRVKAWILKEANGQCENCGSEAPFCTPERETFLEVHHLRHLADGGSDTIHNAVALCPNCHRQFHYGANIPADLAAIYAKNNRLKRE